MDKYSAWRESFTKLFAELEQEDYQTQNGRWGKYNEEWDEEPVTA